MTILLALIIVQIGNVIIVDMNGLPPYLREQGDINAPNVTNNLVSNKNNNMLNQISKRQKLEMQLCNEITK